MVKAQNIRALVLYSRSSFFYVNGRPQGIFYEALQDFEQFVNQKLLTRQHVQVTFIPVRPDQLESYLNEGIGDLNLRELAVIVPLIAAMIWVGLYPGPLLKRTAGAAQHYVDMVQPALPKAALPDPGPR